jgi:ABC-type sulfate/molybdate transport systems ATPase subunit
VALARALCAEPSVLLLDEPLASLDPAVRRDVRAALLAARAASGAAMVLVTHDLDDALAVATQMSAISGGRLTAPELPATMLQAPPSLDVARLLGVYAEVHGTVSGDASGLFHWIGGAVPASGVAAGAMIACVRSHEVTVRAACDAASPELIVTARRDGALDSTLTVATPAGEQAVVRVGSGVVCAVGDAVQLTITASRFFFPD